MAWVRFDFFPVERMSKIDIGPLQKWQSFGFVLRCFFSLSSSPFFI